MGGNEAFQSMLNPDGLTIDRLQTANELFVRAAPIEDDLTCFGDAGLET